MSRHPTHRGIRWSLSPFLRSGAATIAAVGLLSMLGTISGAQEIARHLKGGDAAAARRAAAALPPQRRDRALAEIAVAQASSGDLSGASQTIRDIENGQARADAIEGAGGGSMADFQPLMNLIQTTVVPDTWEALGGPSTMAPYPGGIYVDPAGTVKTRETVADQEMVAEIEMLLKPTGKSSRAASLDAATVAGNESWRDPSTMRAVSLRRLLETIIRQQHRGRPLDPATRHLAGLSTIRYIVITDHDIVIAGRVGGIEKRRGWYRDRETARVPIGAESLAVCLASALDGRPFGCTIDPTAAGLQNASGVAAQINRDEIPIARAGDALASALGKQRVEIFGTAGDTATGYLMLEADRHMKQLALGRETMPDGVRNYLDVVDHFVDRGLPDQMLLRLWFTANQIHVRCDNDRRIFEMAGRPVQLSGQNERALAGGGRGAATVDFRTQQFVEEFNRNWMAIGSRYPIYSALESLYRGASVAEILNRHATTRSQRGLLTALALIAGDRPSSLRVPKQVDSIAVQHTIRRDRKRHHLLMASGGVSISPSDLLPASPQNYPSLDSVATLAEDAPKGTERWWWDVDGR